MEVDDSKNCVTYFWMSLVYHEYLRKKYSNALETGNVYLLTSHDESLIFIS